MFTISKESAIPLHVQLLNELRRAILSGKLKPHEQLPGEYVLTAQLGISRSTVQRAWQAAQEEGLIYRVPAKGTFVGEPRSATQGSRFVGCIVAEFRYTFDGRLLDGAEELLRKHGFRILFAQTYRRVEEENRLIRNMCEEGVSAIILWPVARSTNGPQTALECDPSIPIVLLDRPIPGTRLPCVTSQNYDGGRQAMDHLLALGHTHIAFAAWSPLDVLPVAERYRAYRDAMTDAGLPLLPVIEVGKPEEAINYRRFAEQAHDDITFFAEFLRRPERPTAIFAMNDLVAVLIIQAAHEAGLRVPHDLSVVGFDNLELCEHTSPPLTTVIQDSYLMGREAVRRLLGMLDGDPTSNTITLLPTKLRVRGSTSAPRH